MKNRKRGFSLVELLIVLAVIAALIATITPVALNAIRKSQATKVAQNIKTLAAAIENAAYVNGLSNDRQFIKSGPGANEKLTETVANIKLLGRDISENDYGVWYDIDDYGTIKVAVFSNEAVDFESAKAVLDGLTKTIGDHLSETTAIKLGTDTTADNSIVYLFEFDVY